MSPVKVFFVLALAVVAVFAQEAAKAEGDHTVEKKQVYTGYPGAYPYAAAGAYPYAAGAYPYAAGAYPYAAAAGAYPYAGAASYPYAAGAYPYARAGYFGAYPYAYGHDDGKYFPGKYGPAS